MIITLSPSKGQDFEAPAPTNIFSTPVCLDDSQILVDQLQAYGAPHIQELMNVSENIANLNVDRFRTFSQPFTQENAKQAIFAFKGDVYSGIEVDQYSEEDLQYAQKHLRILSGLYGYLKPLDLIQPYRLEMGTKLENERGKNLYQFWGEQLTEYLNEELVTHDEPVLVNLASNEYFKSIKPKLLKGRLLNINFKETKNGKTRVVAIFAKRARGMMTDYILRNRIGNVQDIKDFTVGGYKYSPADSDEKTVDVYSITTMNMIYQNEKVRIEVEESEIPWLKVFAQKRYKEFTDCDAETKKEIWYLLDVIEREMLDYYQPDKINIASFANYVPQVHWHVMARFKTDSYFPEPMWGEKQREGKLDLPDFDGFTQRLLKRIMDEQE